MDSAQVFFIDSAFGPEPALMNRKNRDGTKSQYQVFKAAVEYNDKMNVIDVIDQLRNGRYSFLMKHSSKKYTTRMFTGLDEMASTNAYNIYRHNKTVVEQSAHGFRNEFQLELVRLIMEFVDQSRRKRSAGPIAEIAIAGGHRIERTEQWIGEGKNKRRKRLDCVHCPWRGDLTRKNHRSCITFCPACNVALHDECFAAYHSQLGFQFTNPFGATPRTTSKGRTRGSLSNSL